MEKKTSPTQLGITTGSIRIYRDDLEEIITILKEVCKEVIIEDNEYRYDSLDEVLTKHGPNPKQLSINSRDPLVIFNVRIKPRHTTLGTSGDGDNLAPYFRVKQILETKMGGIKHYMLSLVPSFTGFGLIFLHVGLNKRFGSSGWTYWLRLSTFVIVGISILVLQTLYNQGAFTKISLKRKHEEATFWTRNKDTIWVAVIAALIGGLITWLITYFTAQ